MPLPENINHGLQKLVIIPSMLSSTPIQDLESLMVGEPNHHSAPIIRSASTESPEEEEEEETLEGLNNVKGYRELVDIVASTATSSGTPVTADMAGPNHDDVFPGDGLDRDDDDDYVNGGTDDNEDTMDEESEAEVFEDILDYGAEMELSQPDISSQSKWFDYTA
jgi:hypothetical protein